MNLDLTKHRALNVVLAAAALLLGCLLLIGYSVFAKYEWAEATISEIEPRYARLLGLRDSAEPLAQAINEARAAISKLAHESNRTPVQIGNELQQVARSAMERGGMSVVNSQVVPPRTEKGIERISVVINVEGSLAALQVVLAALEAESPRIASEQLRIQATGRNSTDGSPTVAVRQMVTVTRVAS